MATINLDVDGVVCDLVGGLFSALRGEGFDPKPIDDPSWKHWFFFSDMPPEMRMVSFGIMSDHNFWRELKPTMGSLESVIRLYTAGHRVQWVTTAWEDCFGWRDARRDWLSQHFSLEGDIDIEKNLVVAKDKSVIGGDVFIDDNPSNVVGWKRANMGRSLLYRSPFNRRYHDTLENIVWSHDTVSAILGLLCQ